MKSILRACWPSTTAIYLLISQQQLIITRFPDSKKAQRPSLASMPMSSRASPWNRLEKIWSQIQVGHQGSYSVERLELLHEYCQTTSFTRVILVCLVTPLPALLVAVLLECLPLRPPSEGWGANWMFWIRQSLVGLAIFAAGIRQMDLYVPGNNISVRQQLTLALWISIVQMGIYIAEAVIVGFPVPFMWQFGVVTVGIYISTLTRLIYGPAFFDKGSILQRQYKNFQDTVFMNFIVTGVYPFCRLLNDSLPQAYKWTVVIMLTIWKYAAKGFAVRMTRQVEDFIPALVAFSVDFFGSLFISGCMSSSNSFYLTALFIGVDVVHLLVKFREISSHEKKILQMLQNRRQTEHTNSDQISQDSDLVTMIIRAVQDSKTYRLGSLNGVRIWADPPHLISEQAYTHLRGLEASGTFGARTQSTSTRTVFAVASRRRFSSWMVRRTSVVPIHIVPTPTHTLNSNGAKGTEILPQNTQSDHLVLNGLQLLFDFEYLMLVEYIECIVPFVYLAYKSVLEQLPNVVYYPGGVGQWGTTAVTNLLVFAVLEVGSLVLVHVFLRRKFAFSPLHQLAFVLETQFHTIQPSLFSFMLFALQYQLAHLGVDFTFRFDWLRT